MALKLLVKIIKLIFFIKIGHKPDFWRYDKIHTGGGGNSKDFDRDGAGCDDGDRYIAQRCNVLF
jgi:hypothetical protein